MERGRTEKFLWKGASLATQYAFASSAVLVVAAILVGTVVAARIEENVVRNSANSTAMFMESVLAPIGQQFAEQDRLSPGARRALEEIFENTPIGERVISYKFWKRGGRIVEASDPAIVGEIFPVTDGLQSAWQGHVAADFEALGDAEDAGEQALGLPLLEIYSPIREYYSGEIIAVVEFYEVHEQLAADLARARRDAWLVVVGAFGGLGVILYLIVLRGSRVIDRQQRRLLNQYAELEALSSHNQELRRRVRDAAGRSAERADRVLRQIGADLHDGPAQQLAFAALRLDALQEAKTVADRQGEIERIDSAIAGALAEIRTISRGLSLPDVADRTPAGIVALAVEEHRARTGNPVETELACDGPVDMPFAARLCLFRFVQEGLNNASRHAEAAGMAVSLACDADRLTLSVHDAGPGFDPEDTPLGLGLSGLRDRIESLGGAFHAGRGGGPGGELRLSFDLGEWK
ncbi:sensor histidine kinase [Tropicimonas sediminicola]|uniref:histidine kinase n=1 Tax=Tropicimonas sediminicola TaxID=1031541 RepID=A0A239EU22_9RHOB|nr:histidine kinase [Tropicimonas sediminicola]SNS48145.1 Signal transduction histidine kinase [Tropicimonas sediminicola]